MLTKEVNDLRTWLKQIRTDSQMTMEDVATESGIERQYYGMIESGVRNPSVKVAKGIASTLDFPWTNFFEIDVNDTTHKKTNPIKSF